MSTNNLIKEKYEDILEKITDSVSHITKNNKIIDDTMANTTIDYNSSQYYTINTSGTTYGSSTGFYTWPNTNYSNVTFTSPSTSNTLEVRGDDADVKINGKSLKTFMEKVEERLSILQPDPKMLEKYEALRNAYEYYKTMEALITKQEKKD